MTERLILTIIAVVMLLLTIQKKYKWTIIITSGLAFGILITWTGIPLVITAGMIIYTITAFMSIIYGVRNKELSNIERIIIGLIGLWALTANLFAIMHLPYANEINLSMMIPLIGYIFLIIKGLFRKKEFGFLTILNAEFLLRLLRFWN
ncbi:MAG: hypothetical protein KAT68_00765 [Bacteroidales bacterium]|nr:hypothetical protein [Bacteroidales bacterium]